MKKAKDPAISVVVSGDVTIDWNLARSPSVRDGGVTWDAEDCTRAYCEHGGAAMLSNLIEAVARELEQSGKVQCEVVPVAESEAPVGASVSRYPHSYAMWKLFNYGERSPFDKEKPAWRVDEFLGLDRCRPDEASEIKQTGSSEDVQADLIVLDDANLGFRDHEELWPKSLQNRKRRPWILVKMAQPVAQGLLWEYLLKNFSDRLIVAMTVNDLRLSEVQISRELSWERTAQDLAWELVYNPRVNSLSRCAHAIVTFDTVAAFLLSRSGKAGQYAPKCTLFFDPNVIEGMWQQEHRGHMIGYGVCLAASMARQIMVASHSPDLSEGVCRGLAAMRQLHRDGYGRRGASASDANLAFPYETIARALAQSSPDFASAEVQDPVHLLKGPGSENGSHRGYWTILEDRYTDSLEEVAERIVTHGVAATLRDVPLGRFGKLLTVDRREIEAYRSIRALIGEYCRINRPKRPLSIAVFGAPGAGKSFGIVEMAKSILPGQIEVREFNLSQLRAPEDILDALHQVRDVGLSGMIPLVFWDEFDTALGNQPLGWLRYFLAPMQDGKFQQGQITHPIGRAIFVFAGGTSETMEGFDRGSEDREFKAVKGPDFVSRLKGYVNVLGPDPKNSNRAVDPYYLIRRAILWRAILSRDARQLFHQTVDGSEQLHIDTGVLRALLHVKRYKHGVRSMESIIAMSSLTGKRKFERSALPAEAQLDLHVDARDFLALVQQMELKDELLEQLAMAAHEVFCEDMRARGYRHGARNDDKRKTSSSLKPYAELTEDEKKQNRGNVRDIANKLNSAGYVMLPARSDEPPFSFPGADLEQLAEMEHERWMRLKFETGWRYAPFTDKKRKRHKALLPWRKLSAEERARLYSPYDGAVGAAVLPESEKKKDRILVLAIPRILSRAGYTVMRITEENLRSPKRE